MSAALIGGSSAAASVDALSSEQLAELKETFSFFERDQLTKAALATGAAAPATGEHHTTTHAPAGGGGGAGGAGSGAAAPVSAAAAVTMALEQQHQQQAHWTAQQRKISAHAYLGPSLRAVGLNPTEATLAAVINQIDDDGSGALSLATYLKVASRLLHEEAQRAKGGGGGVGGGASPGGDTGAAAASPGAGGGAAAVYFTGLSAPATALAKTLPNINPTQNPLLSVQELELRTAFAALAPRDVQQRYREAIAPATTTPTDGHPNNMSITSMGGGGGAGDYFGLGASRSGSVSPSHGPTAGSFAGSPTRRGGVGGLNGTVSGGGGAGGSGGGDLALSHLRISVAELRRLLTTTGEPLTENELDDFLREADADADDHEVTLADVLRVAALDGIDDGPTGQGAHAAGDEKNIGRQARTQSLLRRGSMRGLPGGGSGGGGGIGERSTSGGDRTPARTGAAAPLSPPSTTLLPTSSSGAVGGEVTALIALGSALEAPAGGAGAAGGEEAADAMSPNATAALDDAVVSPDSSASPSPTTE